MAAPIRSIDEPLPAEGVATGLDCPGIFLRGASGIPREASATDSDGESPALVGGTTHRKFPVPDSNINICTISGTEPPCCLVPQADVDRSTSDRTDEVASAKASVQERNFSGHITGVKLCSLLNSLPTHCANEEQLNRLHHPIPVCGGHGGQLLRNSHSYSVARDDEQPSSLVHVPCCKYPGAAKRRESGPQKHAASKYWSRGHRRSSSDCHCKSPARKSSSSLVSRLHTVVLPVANLGEKGDKLIPRKFFSVEECPAPKETRERDSTRGKRRLPSLTLCPDTKKTVTGCLTDGQHNEMKNTGVSQPERTLSIILGTEDTNKAVSTGLMQSSTSQKSQLLNVSPSKPQGGEGVYAVDVDQSVEECCADTKDCSAISEGKGRMTQRSDSLGQSESLLLDFDVDSSSTRSEHVESTHLRDQGGNESREARSSDSAQLSPQPEFSFVWSGSGSATFTWSALEPGFLRSTAPNMWTDLSSMVNDEPVAAEEPAHVKNVSVPDRPASPGKDDAWAAGTSGRAKRTVSCPLSFDAESICYETGDQEAFKPRQSSSNCWCCDKDERGLENQGSAHMEIQEYLRLKERLNQRNRTPAPREDLKSDHSGVEQELDMATLDCSVAGRARPSHVVELFNNLSSSSLPRTVDSLEEWFKEGLPAFYEDFPEDRHGTFQAMEVVADERRHLQHGKNKRHHCEFSEDCEGCSTSAAYRTGPRKILNRTEKAAASGNSPPVVLRGILQNDVSGVLDVFGKYNSPTGAFEGSGESTGSKQLAQDGLLRGEGAASTLHPPPAHSLNPVTTRYIGMQLAEELDKFATGMGLNDVAFVTCRPNVRVPQVPRLDDADFSKYVADNTLSAPEALARMTRIVCKEGFGKK